ncbi:AglZ/HisF2 family acetamidino modification protein [Mesorhizobium sp. UC22_110]|uniref:AglZ/HisF2 family acetamidino modification protein n=1 Tax=unclassified Mesorhizobium TaxID=325217 RepID=UPI0036B2D6E5
MLRTRVIPCLLLRGGGLYKTVKFKDPKYVGDPINAVRIFNEKEVDEILVLDIGATSERREPNFELIRDIASECFMPLAYGGGITDLGQMRRLQRIGVEKVAINSAAFRNPDLVRSACDALATSSVVAAIDVKRSFFGKYEVWIDGGRTNTKADPVQHAVNLAKLGVGEILINNIDRDGTMSGYDVALIKKIAESVDTPVIACGGAGSLDHIQEVTQKGHVEAAAAGSLFVFHGRHRAVLINYPSQQELEALLD